MKKNKLFCNVTMFSASVIALFAILFGVFLIGGFKQKSPTKAEDVEPTLVELTQDDFVIKKGEYTYYEPAFSSEKTIPIETMTSLTEEGKAKFVGDGPFSVTISMTRSVPSNGRYIFGYDSVESYYKNTTNDTTSPLKDYKESVVSVEFLTTGSYYLYGICSKAFFDFTALKSATFNTTSIKYIGQEAFHYCSSLESIKLPRTLETIEYRTFADCTSLTDIDFTYVQNIRSEAFTNCPLTKIVISSYVRHIESDAFYCPSLKYIRFDSNKIMSGSTTTIESNAFPVLNPDHACIHFADLSGFKYIDAQVSTDEERDGWGIFGSLEDFKINRPVIIIESTIDETTLKNKPGIAMYEDFFTIVVNVTFKRSPTESEVQEKLYHGDSRWVHDKEANVWKYDEKYQLPEHSEKQDWYVSDELVNTSSLASRLLYATQYRKEFLTLTLKTEVSALDISLDWTSKPFTGYKQVPNLVMPADLNLVEEEDYTLYYNADWQYGPLDDEEEVKRAGNYEIILKGMGDWYSQRLTLPFTITKVNLSDPSITVGEMQTEFVYDKLPHYNISPTLTLNKDTDHPYELKYLGGSVDRVYDVIEYTPEDTTNCGEKVLTVEPNTDSSFEGKLTFTIYIRPRNIEERDEEGNLKLKIVYDGEYVFTGKQIIPSFDLSIIDNGKVINLYYVDYDVTFEENKYVGEGGFTISTQNNDNLTGSVRFPITIKPKPINDNYTVHVESIPDVIYDGEEHKPDGLSIEYIYTYGEIYKLVEGYDYKLEYEEDYTNYGIKYITIKALEGGNFIGQTDIWFNIKQRPVKANKLNVTLEEGNEYIFTGSKIQPKVTGLSFEDEGKTYSLTFPRDFLVHYDGFENINVGTGRLALTTAVGSNFSLSLEWEFTISPVDIGGIIIDGLQKEIMYDGDKHEQDKNLTLYFGDERQYQLDKEKDYTISYKPDVRSRGVKTIIITAKEGGNFTGSTTTTFTITPRPIDNAVINAAGGYLELTLGRDEYVFTGSPVKPFIEDVNAVYQNGLRLQLTSGHDYYAEYGENIKAGQGTIKILTREDANFEGTYIYTFEIHKADISKTTVEKIENVTYDGLEHRITDFEVKFGDYVLEYDVDYGLGYYYTNFIYPGEKTITIMARENGNFINQTTTTFTIEKRSLRTGVTLEIEEADFTYTGNYIEPKVTSAKINLGEIAGVHKLIKNTEYTVEYYNNLNAGEGSIVIVAGQNSYFKDNFVQHFTINKRSINQGLKVTYTEESYTFLGHSIYPDVAKVELFYGKYGTDKITLTTRDYEQMGHSSAEYAGEFYFTIKAKENGNFTGSHTEKIMVNPADISTTNVDPIASITYDGKEHKPKFFEVKLGVVYVLTESVEYILQYDDIDYINPGEKTITIVAKGGNFTGTKIVPFTIEKRDINSGLALTLENTTYSYTGSNIEPEITSAILTFDDNQTLTLTADDYIVSYGNNLNVGIGSVTVTAVSDGKYTGSTTAYFTIEQAVNEFVFEFDIKSFKQGTNFSEPMVVSQFGEVSIRYFDMGGNEYTFDQLKTAKPGKYKAVVNVEGTENYSGFTDVEYIFEIVEDKAIEWYVYVAIAGGVVLIAAAILLVVLKFKMKKKYEKTAKTK